MRMKSSCPGVGGRRAISSKGVLVIFSGSSMFQFAMLRGLSVLSRCSYKFFLPLLHSFQSPDHDFHVSHALLPFCPSLGHT
jgi:hypothetical protein